jgi:hypothetical protein
MLMRSTRRPRRGGRRVRVPLGRHRGGESDSSGADISPKAKGAKRDDLHDAEGLPGGLFDPIDPLFRYADLRKVIFFCDHPDDPASNTTVSIRLHGVYPNRPFNATYHLILDKDVDFTPDAQIEIQLFGNGIAINGIAQYIDIFGSQPLPPLAIHFNEEFDVPGSTFGNCTLEQEVPTELLTQAGFFAPGSEPFAGTLVTVDSFIQNDPAFPIGLSQVFDNVEPFIFALVDPEPEQGMRFIKLQGGGDRALALYCWGFQGSPQVQAKIDGQNVGTTYVNDVGVTHWKYGWADGEYSEHIPCKIYMTNGFLPPNDTYNGFPRFNVVRGGQYDAQFTYENNGYYYQSNVKTEYVISTNDWITTSDTQIRTRPLR